MKRNLLLFLSVIIFSLCGCGRTGYIEEQCLRMCSSDVEASFIGYMTDDFRENAVVSIKNIEIIPGSTCRSADLIILSPHKTGFEKYEDWPNYLGRLLIPFEWGTDTITFDNITISAGSDLLLYSADDCVLYKDGSEIKKEEPVETNTQQKDYRKRALTKEQAEALEGTGYNGTRPNSSAEALELAAAQVTCKECGYHSDNGHNSLCDYCED